MLWIKKSCSAVVVFFCSILNIWNRTTRFGFDREYRVTLNSQHFLLSLHHSVHTVYGTASDRRLSCKYCSIEDLFQYLFVGLCFISLFNSCYSISGVASTNLKIYPDLFVSLNGGYGWNRVSLSIPGNLVGMAESLVLHTHSWACVDGSASRHRPGCAELHKMWG